MSDIIHLLPDSVANQIAAGEVIQRPASVIKELVENAVDAGAQHIHVLITDSGRTCIQVIDDGKGMSETDARLAFERHATSKISSAADLFALRTMGFRGEALASIAAVAQVELKTRQAQQELGTRLVMAGSQVEAQEPVMCPVGSSFAIRNLFYNVPARRRFLKSDTAEMSHILQEFERVALVHPHIAFTLQHNGSELFNLPTGSLKERIVSIFGKKLNQQLLSVNADTTFVKISGYTAKPEASRKRGAHQYFFVNNRYMRHPYFYKAVVDAYEQLIPTGDQVSFFLYFEIDPASIDVNIHPTKTEIKFENEQGIWQILSAAIKEALGRFNVVPSIDFDTEDMPDIPPIDLTRPIEPPRVNVDTGYNPFKQSGDGYSGGTGSYSRTRNWEGLYDGLEKPAAPSWPTFDADDTDEPDTPASETTHNPAMPQPSGTLYASDTVMEKGNEHLQHKGRYILGAVKSGLLIIDQHRAHIRVLFERYLSQLKQRQGVSQGMLFPDILQLPASEAAIFDSITDDLTAIGFDVSNLGGGSYAINGIPAGIEGLDPVTLLRNMLHTAMEKGSDVKEEIQTTLALSLARAAAIVYGQVLSAEEMRNLVDSLFACSTPNHTPDGYTILATVKEEDIERLFR